MEEENRGKSELTSGLVQTGGDQRSQSTSQASTPARTITGVAKWAVSNQDRDDGE